MFVSYLVNLCFSFGDNKNDINFKSVLSRKTTFEPAPTFEPLVDEKAPVLVGYYPTTPERLGFSLKYFKEEGNRRLAGIKVYTTGK